MDRRSFLGFVATLPFAGKLIGKALEEKPVERKHKTADPRVERAPLPPLPPYIGDIFYHRPSKTQAVINTLFEDGSVEMQPLPVSRGGVFFMRQNDLLNGKYVFMGNVAWSGMLPDSRIK